MVTKQRRFPHSEMDLSAGKVARTTAAATQPLPTTTPATTNEDVLGQEENQGATALKEAIFKSPVLRSRSWRSWCCEDTFVQLGHLLTNDPDPEVRVECAKVLDVVASHLGPNLSLCMRVTLPSLLSNLDIDDHTSHVSQWAARATVALVEHSHDPSPFLEVLDILKHPNIIKNLPLLFSPKLISRDWSPIADKLCTALLDDLHPEVAPTAKATLQGLQRYLGTEKFQECIRDLDPQMRQTVTETLGGIPEEDVGADGSSEEEEEEDIPSFSFVPQHVIRRLMDAEDWRVRVEGADELRLMMVEASDIEALEMQCADMVTFLDRLLGDTNFKVALVALEVLALLVDKLKYRVKAHLTAIVDTLARHLGGPKIVVKTETLRVFKELMRCVGAALVVTALARCLHHKHSKVREEILNVVIVAILTFPSYEFDMKALCDSLAPSLVDDKRRVRHAALECFAVLAQAMGSSKLAILVTAINALGTDFDTEGALSAVIARLARRQLPKVGPDGSVQYSVRVPSGSGRGSSGDSASSPQEMDVQWILAGSGTSSARSLREGSHEARFVPVWRPQAASFPGSPAAARRTVSPSRCRIRLPWEECNSKREMTRSESWRTLSSSSSAGNAAKDASVNSPIPPRVTSWTDFKTLDTINLYQHPLRPGTSHKRSFNENWRNHSGEKCTRPLDKVANMLGGGILPNKVWPITEPESSQIHPKIAGAWSKSSVIPPLSPERSMSSLNSTWPSSMPKPVVGAPGLGGRKRVLGPILDSTIYHQNPRMSTSSGRRILKVPPIGQTPEIEDVDDEGTELEEQERENEVLWQLGSTPHRNRQRPAPGEDLPVHTPVRDAVLPTQPRRPKSLDLRLTYSSSDISSILTSSREDDFEDGNYEMELATPIHRIGFEESAKSSSSTSSSSLSFSSSPRILPKPLPVFPEVNRPSRILKDQQPHRRSASLDRTRIIKWKSSLSWELVPEHRNDVQNANITPVPLEKPKPNETPPFTGKPVIVRSPAQNRQRTTIIANTNGNENDVPQISTNGINANGYLIAPRKNVDLINVIGKGVLPAEEKQVAPLPSPPSPPLPTNYNNNHLTIQTPTSDDNDLPSVQGVTVLTKIKDDDLYSVEDEVMATSLSKTTFNKMLSKKKEIVNAERKKAERQRKLYQQRKAFNEELSVQDLDNVEKNPSPTIIRPRPPPGKPPTFTRKRNKIASTNSVELFSNSTGSLSSLKQHQKDDLTLSIRNPDDSLRTAMSNLENSEWTVKCEGIRLVTHLTKNNPQTVNGELHAITLLLVNEVKNLRSSVSRAAIACFGEMFTELKKNMETDLELVCRTLLHKSGESNAFIKEDVEKALVQMADNVNPQRSIPALVLGGANHRNPAVRKMTASLLSTICEKLGPSRVMSGAKDLTERIIPTAAVFVMDGSPLTRYYGRKMFDMILTHPEFDKVTRQYLQPTTLRNIRDILEGLRTKGLGSMPNESASSRTQKVPK